MNTLSTVLITLGLLAGMLLCLEIGRRIAARQIARDPEGARAGSGAVDGAIFALLGLLIAFTFSGAAARFDVRRQLIVAETNAIGTAYLRLDLLPQGAQPALRESFRRYVDSRLDVYRKLPDMAAVQAELARNAELQRAIWSQAIAAAPASQAATILLLPALNAMIDITTTRTMAAQTHPPLVVFAMLFALSLASALLAGHGMAGARSRSWLHTSIFAAALAVSVYVILDIEFPRLGLVRVDAFDQALMDLRKDMK